MDDTDIIRYRFLKREAAANIVFAAPVQGWLVGSHRVGALITTEDSDTGHGQGGKDDQLVLPAEVGDNE